MPKVPRQAMPVQDPGQRVCNFREVALGYDHDTALIEAGRCLNCKRPFCVEGCPVGVDIPGFIAALVQEDMEESVRRLRQKTSLPAVCGRVCPQENQCEKTCILAKTGQPVAIGRLERYVADWEAANGKVAVDKAPSTGQRVAVVGAGPAGLSCAGELAARGYEVTIFEALHTPGGVLMYGIPEFRLPEAVVQREIQSIQDLGVEIITNAIVGKLYTLAELEEDYQAFFVGTGAGLPHFMGIPGENFNGIYSANEFLTRANLMRAFDYPHNATPIKVGKKVAVIGGGNVAMDAARTALRLGAEESTIVYRRSKEEIPARAEELDHALEEGVQLKLLASPIAYHGDEDSTVISMTLQKYELGQPDASGRRRPIPIQGETEYLEVDTVVVAIGQGPNPILIDNTPGLATDHRGNIDADGQGQTSLANVFAGGDIVTGAATVIQAMGAGKTAAASIDTYLRGLREER